MENLINDINRLISRINCLEDALLDRNNLSMPLQEAIGKLPSKEGDIVCNATTYKYRFHGAGCTFDDQNDNYIDYDFVSKMGVGLNFSLWKLSRSLNAVSENKVYTLELLNERLKDGSLDHIFITHPDGKNQLGVRDEYRSKI